MSQDNFYTSSLRSGNNGKNQDIATGNDMERLSNVGFKGGKLRDRDKFVSGHISGNRPRSILKRDPSHLVAVHSG